MDALNLQLEKQIKIMKTHQNDPRLCSKAEEHLM